MAFAAVLAAVACADPARADPVRGTAVLTVAQGHARLILKLDDDVETEVSVAGAVLVVRFKRPVEIGIDRLTEAAPDYIGSARRDPDGLAMRFSLQRKVTVNAMSAGERTFIDLLPDTWSGSPPGLPQDVVRELANRARTAERALRQRAGVEMPKRRPLRVRASVQPTLVRLVFELPDGVAVSSSLDEQKLIVAFAAPLTFDLADARGVAPAPIGALAQKIDGERSSVEIELIGEADVRSFREDKTYVVDIVKRHAEKPRTQSSNPEPAGPARGAAIEAPPLPPDDLAMPTSETIARLVKRDSAADASKPSLASSLPLPLARPPVPSAVASQPASAGASALAAVEVQRSNDGLRLTFPFSALPPAALFRRADMMWLILDSKMPIDLSAVRRDGGALIGDAISLDLDQGQAIRMRLNRPQLASLTAADPVAGTPGWVLTFADAGRTAPQPLEALRNIADPDRASVMVPLAGAGMLHRLVDPDVGDVLSVATASPPGRGFLRRQDFIEFALLESIHGAVVQSHADDISVEVLSDRVVLNRPGGLMLSAAIAGRSRATSPVRPIFDLHEWQLNQQGPFRDRLDVLMATLARAAPAERMAARGDLARFYFARGFYPEAKGVVDAMLPADKSGHDDAVVAIMQAVANVLMGRPDQALKDLAGPALGTNYDTQLWKALAFSEQGKWSEAREKFKNAGFAINALPLDIQRIALAQAMLASVEVKDFADAAARSSELDLVGIPPQLRPRISLLRGRLAEGLGRDGDALPEYRAAAQSGDRPTAVQGRLFEIALLKKLKNIAAADALRDLETFAVTWRGDSIEVKTLQMLAQIYGQTGRYGDALAAARTATKMQANSDVSRQLQDDAAVLFAQLFLTSKGDDLPPIEALATFYDNSELTPIGRRGDELIRRLSERLVGVDLLDQAGELLQYQVDNRLEGAARAQVATRLATVYLMNRKPDRAIGALHATRIADLPGELRQQRLLLEARAQSDIGRRDLALDIISDLDGREVIRLRSDIYWAGRRWRESSEQIELLHGDRWRDFTPLNAVEKSDVVRAVIGYALAEDSLGLARFRDKYAPLMSAAADRIAFDSASTPASTSSTQIASLAKLAAGVDTLDGFLHDMKSRFVDATARAPLSPEAAKADPATTGSLPRIIGMKRAESRR